jgi:uncharacterized membrane protein YeaQ/YmgE (transglycosylase-associated protein family)
MEIFLVERGSALAKFVMRDQQSGGILITIVLGVVGALVGGWAV